MKTISISIFIMALAVSCSFGFELKPVSEISETAFRVWDVSKGPITIFVSSNGSDDLPLNTVESEIQSAVTTWQEATNNDLLNFGGSRSSLVSNSSDEINSISFIESGWQYSSAVLAITKYTYTLGTPPYMIDADILFNGKNWHWAAGQTTNKGNVADLQQVAIHELGHLLGLSHTSVYKAALYPYLPEKVIHKLNRDDKAGVKFLYDSPAPALVPITPVRTACYVEEMTSKGLPLPVFRWYAAGHSNFTLEFSSSLSFINKVSIPVGSNSYYAFSSSDEKKLTAMGEKLFWRVTSGSESTAPRVIKFKSLL